MIEWGNRRIKAGTVPVNLLSGRQLIGEPIVGDKPPLIDVADMLSYATSHAFCATELPDRASFGQAFDAFLPVISRMDFHPQLFEGSAYDQNAVSEWLAKGLHPYPHS
jgi:hypothetical protein